MNIIYSYTRKQTIEDGQQRDVSATAAEAGIKFPVFGSCPDTLLLPVFCL
jgi:hypothetical protein